jgi:hypothetical protein
MIPRTIDPEVRRHVSRVIHAHIVEHTGVFAEAEIAELAPKIDMRRVNWSHRSERTRHTHGVLAEELDERANGHAIVERGLAGKVDADILAESTVRLTLITLPAGSSHA